MAKKPINRRPSVSRRKFVTRGAVAAAVAAGTQVDASSTAGRDLNIAIPREIAATLSEASNSADFPMTGAQVFAKACKAVGLAALSCAPGNYVVINAVASKGIPCYGGRTEGAICAAADGFARVTRRGCGRLRQRGPGIHEHDHELRLRERGPALRCWFWRAT